MASESNLSTEEQLSMEQKICIVQDTWTEEDDQELHEYLKKSDIRYEAVDRETIKTLRPMDLEMIFCDTDLMQELLRSHHLYNEIETYPESLNKFYNRDIKKIQPKVLLDSSQYPYPYFIKPVSNDKSFNGTLISSEMERDFVMSQMKNHDDLIYYCHEIKPVNEYRIFVVDHKMFGIVDCSDFLIDTPIRKSVPPSTQYIDDVLKHNTYSHCVIDVAMDKSGDFWYVIEVNPPFSLMSYGFPIDRYVEFCKLSWKSYVANISQISKPDKR